MKRMIQWVVAATLVCGLTVFTACSKDDDSDTPAATQGKLVTLPQGVVSKGYTMQTVRTVNTIDGAQTVYEKKNVQAAFDGQDVYVSGFSSSFPESFVKGTLTSAGTCRFESGQYVGEDKTGEKYVVGIMGTGDKANQLTDIECTYDPEMHILTIPEDAKFAIAESDAPSHTQVANILQNVTVMPGSFKEPSVVTPPEGLTTQQWYFTGSSDKSYCLNYGITIAFDGNDVYVLGLFNQFPQTWLRGRLEDGVIIFKKGQFLGYYKEWQEILLAVAGETSLTDLKLNYDAEKGIMLSDDCICMIDIDKKSVTDYLDQVYITRQRYVVPDPIIPPTGVTYEPYRFDFESLTVDNNKLVKDEDAVDEVFVAIDGSDFYMKLFTVNASGWAKGKIGSDGRTVTFPSLQYIGTWQGIDVHEDYYLTAFTDIGQCDFVPVDLVLDYNAEDGIISCSQLAGISSSYRLVRCFTGSVFGNARFTKKKEVAATPAAPEVDLDYNELRKFFIVNLKISLIGVNGADLLTEKLSYKLWYEKDGQQHELVFRADEQEELNTDMVEIPYRFRTNSEFAPEGNHVEIHKAFDEVLTWTKIGAQTIYRGGGEEHSSPISWFDATDFYREKELIK